MFATRCNLQKDHPMKRFTLALIVSLASVLSAKAISYNEARSQAWFLTDKMAYELNLTPQQYEWVYEVNLDYFMSVKHARDCEGIYWTYRNDDLYHILSDWQDRLYTTIQYVYRPLRWWQSRWYYPICEHYRYGYYYFDCPHFYHTYQGCSWRRRGHNEVSHYSGRHHPHGPGMRDHYDNNRPGGRPDYRPDNGRPSKDYNDRYGDRKDNHRNDNGKYEPGSSRNDKNSGRDNGRNTGGKKNNSHNDNRYSNPTHSSTPGNGRPSRSTHSGNSNSSSRNSHNSSRSFGR